MDNTVRMPRTIETRGGATWTEGRALVSTQCACPERSRGKYKKLEHSKGIYFPTLMISAKPRTIQRKQWEQIQTILAVTPMHN